ncbi:MAG TPA: DsbA family protein [Albidovulum sp.]|uniref:DsbA family protein n=1 Tax=Albidovulum sp. TaxID=1872424 RepID=UPI002BA460B8|nr:DsbA family protein [Albidovulum sp.]
MTAKRRDLLILGGVVALIYGIRALPWDWLPGRGPRYVEIKGLPQFRQLEDIGPTSGATVALIGLDPPSEDAALRRARVEEVRADLCGALFGAASSAGTVPIAYFSEFQCPYCRALERDLDVLLADEPNSVRLVQHELPIFGPASELAARASVAAARQGKQQALRRRFMRMPIVADERSVRSVAADVGLDGDQLVRDMASPEVQAELDRTRALADLFGFIGTPGLVVGRTVLNGALPYALLRRIVKDESTMPEPVC